MPSLSTFLVRSAASKPVAFMGDARFLVRIFLTRLPVAKQSQWNGCRRKKKETYSTNLRSAGPTAWHMARKAGLPACPSFSLFSFCEHAQMRMRSHHRVISCDMAERERIIFPQSIIHPSLHLLRPSDGGGRCHDRLLARRL